MGVSVDQVKVVEVISGGLSNWGLRLIANGRYTAFELFRSRLEAMIAFTLTKSFYKLQSEIDIQKLVAHFNSFSEDLTDWTVKQQAVQAMCDDIVPHLCQYLSVDKNQKFLEQIEALKVENEKLRQQKGQESTSNSKPSELSLPQMFGRNPPSVPSGEKSASVISLQQFRCSTHAPCILGTQSSSGGNQGAVTQWINKTVRKDRKDQLEGIIKEIKQEYEFLDAGTRPSIERIQQLFCRLDLATEDYHLAQTDIAGFCNQVEHNRICGAIEFAVSRYANMNCPDGLDTIMQAHTQKLERTCVFFKAGTGRTPPSMYQSN